MLQLVLVGPSGQGFYQWQIQEGGAIAAAGAVSEVAPGVWEWFNPITARNEQFRGNQIALKDYLAQTLRLGQKPTATNGYARSTNTSHASFAEKPPASATQGNGWNQSGINDRVPAHPRR